ncbi:hypothetical protein AB4567_01875, partial [Vibrio sp. 10N.222.51.A6]
MCLQQVWIIIVFHQGFLFHDDNSDAYAIPFHVYNEKAPPNHGGALKDHFCVLKNLVDILVDSVFYRETADCHHNEW